jgi:hypothetical protein
VVRRASWALLRQRELGLGGLLQRPACGAAAGIRIQLGLGRKRRLVPFGGLDLPRLRARRGRSHAGNRQGVAQQSKQDARELQQKSQQAAPTAAAKAHAAPTAAAKHAGKAIPAMQAKVERQLEHGKVVAILFWNPKGSVDAIVQREVHAARRNLGGGLAVDVARAGQVGSFGTFTHAVQVDSTPTILMVNTKGVTSSVSGLTDAFAIEQAVKDVKRAH